MPYADPEKRKAANKAYRLKHLAKLNEYQKKYREENKEQIKNQRKEYYDKNHEQILENKKKYYQDHVDGILENKRKYYDENYEELKEKHREYNATHKEELVQYREKNKERMKEYRQSPAKFDSYFEKFSPYYKLDIEMRRDPKNQELIQFRCKYCGGFFNPTIQQLDSRYKAINGNGSGGDAELYCSKACKKSCPIYNQKKWPKGFKDNTSREVQPELRKMVLERDNWTCQKCGKSKAEYPELELHCHHMLPINEDPIRSADIDNCETLCKECHQWKHKNIPGCSYKELQCA